jgi:polar amino acid transport system substrate-binding protein
LTESGKKIKEYVHLTFIATMKYKIQTVLLMVSLFLSGCTGKKESISSLEELKGGKTFAVPTGTVADQMVLKKFPDAKISYYNTVLDCAIAVREGKADAASYDLPVLKNIAAQNEGIWVLPELMFDDRYGFAVRLGNHELKTAMDSTLAAIKADGTYEAMMKRWFPERGKPGPMPEFEFSGNQETLRFGTAAVTEPMSFHDANRKIAGFDIEFASRIALRIHKRLEIIDMEFGAMIPALISGKVDMIGAGLSITEERAKSVLFSESYYPSGIAALVKGTEEKGKNKISNASMRYGHTEDIRNKKIGVLMGSIHDKYANRDFPEAGIFQYQNVTDLITAVKTNKVDVAFADHVALKDILKKNPELGYFAANLYSVPMAAPFNEENDTLREKFNAFLSQIRANGIYQEMVTRWMEKEETTMPELPVSGTNGILRVGIVSDIGLPSTIRQENGLAGFDIELSKRFAAYLGKNLEYLDLPFGSIIASLSTKKIDMATCSMMITEEREKQVDFSDSYYESGVSLFALKENISGSELSGEIKGASPVISEKSEKRSFLKKISDSFYNNIILEKRYLLIINGLMLTILISLFSALLGTMLGGLVCYMRMSVNKMLSSTAKVYILLLRGTPVLVLLMIIYYVVFASVNISAAIVAVIAFGLNFGAYVSEMYRTAIESIDKGQWEAGIAGGFTKVQTFIHIIMPQALRHVLPVYKGEFISLVKMTSIVGYIAVQDLTKASDIIRSRTFDAFFPLIMAAVIYLTLAWILAWALGRIEISVDPKRKINIKVKEAVK